MNRSDFLEKLAVTRKNMGVGYNELVNISTINKKNVFMIESSKDNVRLLTILSYLEALNHTIVIYSNNKKHYINSSSDFASWSKNNRGNYTKYRIEKETGIKQSVIFNVENKNNFSPTIDTVLKLVDFLGAKIDIEPQEKAAPAPTIQECIEFLYDYTEHADPSSEDYKNNMGIIKTIIQLIKQKNND